MSERKPGIPGLSPSEWQLRIRSTVKRWDGAFGLDPESLFFEGWEEMPDFQYKGEEAFSMSVAWWLAELCRLAYTPDRKERNRKKFAGLPDRDALLHERSPFEELLSIHKTGNHASIYRRRDNSGPTVLCFRGTSRTRQWIMNAVVRPHRWKRFRLEGDPEEAFVHSGFYVFLKRVWPLLEAELVKLPRPWIIAGHSLGGALSMLVGPLIHPDLICTFGSPKVGNEAFYDLKSGTAVWRLVNHADLVPHLPLRDRTVGARNFAHGHPGGILGEASGITFEPVPGEGAAFPLEVSQLGKAIESPPQWLVDHRIGEYCRKLRLLNLGGMQH